jgi:hypothetical protein
LHARARGFRPWGADYSPWSILPISPDKHGHPIRRSAGPSGEAERIVSALPQDFLWSAPLRFRVRARFRKAFLAQRIYQHRWPLRADVVLLSFPKAGRTWLRVMLGQAMAEHFGISDADLFKLDRMGDSARGIPRIKIKHDDNPQLKVPEELVPNKSEYRGVKVVYLVRDIRDLAVSNYFEFTRRRGQEDRGLSAYLRSRRGSVDTMIRHYNIWAANRHVPADFHLVRYEDLHADSAGCLGDLLAFLGIANVNGATVRRAIEFASFGNMHRMERSGSFQHRRLCAMDASDRETYKTRRGKVAGYLDYLSSDDIDLLNGKIRAELDPFYGYT